MILTALAEYYQRLADDPNVEIAPFGWFQGRLDFLVKLNKEGEFVSLQNLKRREGKKSFGRPTLLPSIGKQSLKHTNSGKDANLLWDNSSFVFGLGNKGAIKLDSFISVLRDNLAYPDDLGVTAVLRFLERAKDEPSVFYPILEHPEFGKEISEGRANVTFALDGDEYPFVFSRPEVKKKISAMEFTDGVPQGTCLITGKENQPIELCHSVIKNIYGVQKDPNLVSFNKDSFNSFGKNQGVNSPSSQRATFAYTTALNYLLASEHQRMQVGDASTVFWAKNSCDFEEDFSFCFGLPKKGEEAVSYEKIRGLLSAVRSGVPAEEADYPFYVLGLAPNASRISIRFWYDGNLKEIKERVAGHFQDIEMIRAPHDPEFLSLRQLLLATARRTKKKPYGDDDDILPHLSGDVARAVLDGLPYPRSLLQKVVNRIKAEQAFCTADGKRLENVSFARASIIKAFLVRQARLSKSNQQEVSMALDKTYDNIGYVLGRLFAVLERIQEQAQGTGLNKTIRDTYFGAATSSPLVTFNRLNQLSIHHLAKIRNGGKNTVWLEKLLGEVNGLLPKEGIPSILDLEDQGRFSVGYYHQRQDFFTKKETDNQGEEV